MLGAHTVGDEQPGEAVGAGVQAGVVEGRPAVVGDEGGRVGRAGGLPREEVGEVGDGDGAVGGVPLPQDPVPLGVRHQRQPRDSEFGVGEC